MPSISFGSTPLSRAAIVRVAWGLMVLFGRRTWDGTSRRPEPPIEPMDEPTLDGPPD